MYLLKTLASFYSNFLQHLTAESLLNSAGEKSEESAAEKAKKGTPIVLQAERDYFERILITMEMMQDHLPDSYLRVINTL